MVLASGGCHGFCGPQASSVYALSCPSPGVQWVPSPVFPLSFVPVGGIYKSSERSEASEALRSERSRAVSYWQKPYYNARQGMEIVLLEPNNSLFYQSYKLPLPRPTSALPQLRFVAVSECSKASYYKKSGVPSHYSCHFSSPSLAAF